MMTEDELVQRVQQHNAEHPGCIVLEGVDADYYGIPDCDEWISICNEWNGEV